MYVFFKKAKCVSLTKETLKYVLDIKDNDKDIVDFTKGLGGFDIGVLCFIIVVGILFRWISFSIIDIIAITLFCLSTIAFMVFRKKVNKSLVNVILLPLLLFKSTLQFFYGYWVFANGELQTSGYKLFTWVHATVATLILILSILFYCIYVKMCKDANIMTIEQLLAREYKTIRDSDKLTRKYPWIVALPFLLPTPYIASKIFGIWDVGEELGAGFYTWLAACLFFFLFSMCVPRLVIYLKYRYLLKQRCFALTMIFVANGFLCIRFAYWIISTENHS